MRFAVLAFALALAAGDAQYLAVHVELHDLAKRSEEYARGMATGEYPRSVR